MVHTIGSGGLRCYAVMTNYRKLVVWQKGRALVRDVYRITATFPKEELFGLVQQMRRAAVSIVSNIAESQSRTSKRERCHFFSIALGSVLEVETQAIVSHDLSYLAKSSAAALVTQTTEIGRMLNAMIRTLSR